MTDKTKNYISEFLQTCEEMDWDNNSNLTISLENAIYILKGILVGKEL